MPPRILPEPTPETQHFWDGTRNGELLLQRCNAVFQRFDITVKRCALVSCHFANNLAILGLT